MLVCVCVCVCVCVGGGGGGGLIHVCCGEVTKVTKEFIQCVCVGHGINTRVRVTKKLVHVCW